MAAGLAREQLVTHTVPAPLEKCTTARHPRCTAAARAVATAVPTKTRVERTLVESSARRILGNPITAMIPIMTTTMISSIVVKPTRRMHIPPVRAQSSTCCMPGCKSFNHNLLLAWRGLDEDCKMLHECRVLHYYRW